MPLSDRFKALPRFQWWKGKPEAAFDAHGLDDEDCSRCCAWEQTTYPGRCHCGGLVHGELVTGRFRQQCDRCGKYSEAEELTVTNIRLRRGDMHA